MRLCGRHIKITHGSVKICNCRIIIHIDDSRSDLAVLRFEFCARGHKGIRLVQNVGLTEEKYEWMQLQYEKLNVKG